METVFSARLLARASVPDEEMWLAAARLGEPWALEQFYRGYQAVVYSLCHRLLGRPEDAQDATQAAFIRAFREVPRFRGESSVKTWLYRIAVNEALGILRKRRDPTALPEAAAGGDGPERAVERLAVQAALARVRPHHRAILVLRYWEGLSYEELAEVLHISLSAARMRLKRAREEFRKCYEDC